MTAYYDTIHDIRTGIFSRLLLFTGFSVCVAAIAGSIYFQTLPLQVMVLVAVTCVPEHLLPMSPVLTVYGEGVRGRGWRAIESITPQPLSPTNLKCTPIEPEYLPFPHRMR